MTRTRRENSIRSNERGFSLLELLISMGIFMILASVLVGVLRMSVDSWERTTRRKEIFERAQVLYDGIQRDLSNLYFEDFVPSGQSPPIVLGDTDQSGFPRLSFVKSLPPDNMPMDPRTSLTDYTQLLALKEIAYVLRPNGNGGMALWRGQRNFDRSAANGFANRDNLNNPAFLDANFEEVDDGVLFLDFHYWTEWTNSWDVSRPFPSRRPWEADTVPPVLRWDSTRRLDPQFALYTKRQMDPFNPDMIVPFLITVVLELESSGARGEMVRLRTPLTAGASRAQIERGEILPESGHVFIGNEWIKYDGRTSDELVIIERGARDTEKFEHDAGSTVRFGQRFVTSVVMSMYRRSQMK